MGESGSVFPLTGLQIGDLQSYRSHLNLFLATKSNRFYILVDNRPWLEDPGSKPAHLWQLMVTKSRLSPFAHSKARKGRKVKEVELESEACPESKTSRSKRFEKWFSLVDAATISRKRAMLPVKKLTNALVLNSKLHRTLYGFIVFEVSWTSVRGINYLNELQTDTSLAIEAKLMKRWEFDSILQAANCMPLWFSGTHDDQLLLKEYLDAAIGEVFYDAEEDFLRNDKAIHRDEPFVEDESPQPLRYSFSVYPPTMENNTSPTHTPPHPTEPPFKRRKVDIHSHSDETRSNLGSLQHSRSFEIDNATTEYKDVLILFKFSDPDLPFKLRKIIMSDLRLLTLLESGLPSWVIFLQSYPGFCHMYRPWMCPLARALYVMISVVTVLIGFYDLYKNVPLLKATASRLCGPLFDWIETWEMITRIKYLGTMLFLHNFQKAVRWSLMVTRTVRSFLSVLAQPMAEPLMELMEIVLPFWNMILQVVESFCSVVWIMVGSSWNLLEKLAQILLYPMWFILSATWSTAMFIIYPIFWILWEVVYAPVRLILGLVSLMGLMCTIIYELIADILLDVTSLFQLASASGAAVTTHEVSMWRSLWNDLFSQIFRAVRSILNGFVAFFMACNRHRLSIYNHTQEFIRRLSWSVRRSRPADSRHGIRTRAKRDMLEARSKIHIN